MGVPYVIVKNKARLGTVVHKKTAAVLVNLSYNYCKPTLLMPWKQTVQDVRSDDQSELSKLVSAAKANYLDK